jgi:predicted GIY-YIG superfamily endonuclease
MSAFSFFVYVLECSDGSTYVGATIDPDHRLRQHNGEIKGGAHATTIKVKQGFHWNRVCCITGFPDWVSALQFEWALKHYSRKLPKRMNPLERRMRGLRQILNFERPTSKALAYRDWPNGATPEIIWEMNKYNELYDTILLV